MKGRVLRGIEKITECRASKLEIFIKYFYYGVLIKNNEMKWALRTHSRNKRCV